MGLIATIPKLSLTINRWFVKQSHDFLWQSMSSFSLHFHGKRIVFFNRYGYQVFDALMVWIPPILRDDKSMQWLKKISFNGKSPRWVRVWLLVSLFFHKRNFFVGEDARVIVVAIIEREIFLRIKSPLYMSMKSH